MPYICPNCGKKLDVSKIDGFLVKHCKNCKFLNKKRIPLYMTSCKQDPSFTFMCKAHGGRIKSNGKCMKYIRSLRTREREEYDKTYRKMEKWVLHFMGKVNMYAV